MSTQKIKSVIIEENGGSEKFKVVENEIGTPGKGEILIEVIGRIEREGYRRWQFQMTEVS